MNQESRRLGMSRVGVLTVGLALFGVAWMAGVACAATEPLPAAPDLAGASLTLERALELALQFSPSLQGYAAATDEARAQAAQAGRGLNPELSFEAENFAGSGTYNGFSGAEFTLALSQTFELGGKRARAQEAVGWRADLVTLEAELAARDLRAATAQAFIAVLAAQIQVELANEMVDLAVRDLEFTERRVRSGTASQVEANRARVAVATARMTEATARQSLRASRVQLAAFWNTPVATFGDVVGAMDDVVAVPGWDDLVTLLVNSPRLRRWDLEANRRRAEVAAAQAMGKLDLTAAAGIRHYQDDGENAAVASVSIPLQVRNKNQDGQRAAEFGLMRLDAERQAQVAALRSELSQQYEQLVTAHGQVVTLRDEILPLTERSVAEMDAAYRKGLFNLTDVLAVRRTWFEARGAYTSELASYQAAASEIGRLLGGTPIASPFSQENN